MAPSVPPPVTLVVGPEAFLAERAVSDVLRAARVVDPQADRHDIDAASGDALGRYLEATSPTLFGGTAVVIVDTVESADDALADAIVAAITAPAPDAVIVLRHAGGPKGRKLLDRLTAAKPAIVAAERPKGRGLDEFVVREFKRHRRPATPDAVAALRVAVGDDLSALAAAVSQLATDVLGDPIDAAAVNEYYDGIAGVSGYATSDAVWAGRPDDALVALRWALERDPSFGPAIVATLASALRSMLRLAAAPPGMRPADLAREVGAPPWKIDSLRATLRLWTPGQLAAAARLLATADAAVKGGGEEQGLDPVQKHLVLERTVLAIANSRGQGRR